MTRPVSLQHGEGYGSHLSVAAMPTSHLTRRLHSVAPLVICRAVTDRHSKTGVVDSECDPHVNKDAMTWKGMSLTTGLGAYGFSLRQQLPAHERLQCLVYIAWG